MLAFSRKLGENVLANLSVRKIDDELYEKLRIRAAHHGVSMEEEVRQILKQTIESPERLGDLAMDYFGAENGVELELPKHKPHDPLDFTE